MPNIARAKHRLCTDTGDHFSLALKFTLHTPSKTEKQWYKNEPKSRKNTFSGIFLDH
jgi:hypothetical protein|tara:strand:+ start:120 stop:290 length:171 start_codon:yes stop_codon:yes gene_type:complete